MVQREEATSRSGAALTESTRALAHLLIAYRLQWLWHRPEHAGGP